MGLRMPDIHTPTVPSGPTTSAPSSSAAPDKRSVFELMDAKKQIEEELSALGSVLDSVYPLLPLLILPSFPPPATPNPDTG